MSNVTALHRTQKCRVCEIEKPLGEFHADRRRPSGVRTICRGCRSDREHGITGRPREITVEEWALLSACHRLAELFPTKFAQLLLSEEIRLGVKSQEVIRNGLDWERVVS